MSQEWTRCVRLQLLIWDLFVGSCATRYWMKSLPWLISDQPANRKPEDIIQDFRTLVVESFQCVRGFTESDFTNLFAWFWHCCNTFCPSKKAFFSFDVMALLRGLTVLNRVLTPNKCLTPARVRILFCACFKLQFSFKIL